MLVCNVKNIIVCSLFLLIFAFFLSCDAISVEKLYNNGVVATSSPIASDIGLRVLKNGGNAIDAAVAIGFVQAVCLPEAGNIGGGGFALIYSAKSGQIKALDFRETAPLSATVDMYLDKDGNVIKNSSLLGAGAAGVPGTVTGLYSLWKEMGTLDWYKLVEPAIMLADTGFIIDDYLAGSLQKKKNSLQEYSETKAVFFTDSAGEKLHQKGDRFIQKDLAATLERIAVDGPDGFYTGPTADMIVDAMIKHNGFISHEDLKTYKSTWREPVKFTFDSLEIYSMPPPSSGGVILAMILGLLEPFDFFQYRPQTAEYIHLFAEACRLAYAERAIHLGDPDFINNPVDELLDPDYLEMRRKLIDIERASVSSEISSGVPGAIKESESTTHYSIVDKYGNAVSLTYTINTSYGSKLVIDGAGFLLNNEMDDFSIKPGEANIYGLVGGEANEITPGKRMLSSMSPTIILLRGEPFMVLGSPGGSKIITTVAQAIINFTRFGLNLEETVEAPRFHHQWLPDLIYLEEGGFDINVKQDLISRGHNIKERSGYSDLQIIHISESGMISGASDPRRGGKTCGY